MASGWGSSGYASNPFASAGGAGTTAGGSAPSAPPAPWAPAAGGDGITVPPAMVAAAATAAAKDKRVRTGILGALGIGGGAGGDPTTRETELARREAAVAAREAELGLAPGAPAPGGLLPARQLGANWPPCVPLIRHSIGEGVVPWHRSTVRFAYLVELLELGAFVYNCVVLLAALIAGVGPGLSFWLISLVAVCLGAPGSWLLWYKQLWSAANSNGSTYAYARELVLLLLNVAFAVWMIIAAKGLGDFSAGIFPLIEHFNAKTGKGTAFGILYIINVCLWGAVAFGSWVVVGLAIKAYRQGGEPARAYEERYGAPATVVA